MFLNIEFFDLYIITYKRTILEDLFNEYVKGNITYYEYYNSNIKKFYIDMIKTYNNLL